VIIAIALSITFVLGSQLNTHAHRLYQRYGERLKRHETAARHPDDDPIDPGNAEIAVFGMGRIGTAVYEFMHQQYGDIVVGVDFDRAAVEEHQRSGRRVILGDPTDYDFWERAGPSRQGKVRLVLLALPEHRANLEVAQTLTRGGYLGKIAAIAQFDDQVEELKRAGAHAAFNFYAEAGLGFAEHVCERLAP
jgi:voltage-gated potassium channel Kch